MSKIKMTELSYRLSDQSGSIIDLRSGFTIKRNQVTAVPTSSIFFKTRIRAGALQPATEAEVKAWGKHLKKQAKEAGTDVNPIELTDEQRDRALDLAIDCVSDGKKMKMNEVRKELGFHLVIEDWQVYLDQATALGESDEDEDEDDDEDDNTDTNEDDDVPEENK